MKTGKTTVSLDGESFVFNFESLALRRARHHCEDDDKYYQSGMLLVLEMMRSIRFFSRCWEKEG